METTEKIVEAYCRYIKGWFTLPNIRCDGQHEIDLLTVQLHPSTRIKKYHIETGISISSSFSKLTEKPFSSEQYKKSGKKASLSRTIDYFISRKFQPTKVLKKLHEYGFVPGKYKKVIVSWGWTDEAKIKATSHGIDLWDFRKILQEIVVKTRDKKSYFSDDTIRTLQLCAKAPTNPIKFENSV